MAEDSEPESRLRLGLIIPSSNRLTEVQFNRYAPRGVEIHVTRLRMTGAHRVPLGELMPQVAEASELLADAACDVIVFHCTASSMEEGIEADHRVIELISEATGKRATSTASALLNALNAVEARRVVLLTPYVQATHQHEVEFLTQAGFDVVRDEYLNLVGSDAYIAVPPARWAETARAHSDADPDAYVLGCTNIRGIEAISDIEASLNLPAITSNQATLWQTLRLGGVMDGVPGLGRLFEVASPD